MLKRLSFCLLLCFVAISLHAAENPPASALRPPAVPLVTFDPYLSIWSGADHLTDAPTKHWTGHPHPLVSLIRIDNKTYRLMGDDPAGIPAFPQQSLTVAPTRTIYEFDDAHIHVTLTFMTAALPSDLEAFSQPLSYLTWQIHSVDGASHAVQLYDSTSALLSVNDPTQPVQWGNERAGNLTLLHAGTIAQPILKRQGDDTRIDWGNVYVAAQTDQAKQAIGSSSDCQTAFIQNGSLPTDVFARSPHPPTDAKDVMAFAFDLGSVSSTPVSRQIVIAYDEIYAIKYFGKPLRPDWRRNGATPQSMLQSAFKNFPALQSKCETFDRDLIADLTSVGGAQYAQIASLAYRQCAAACGLAADANGQPLFFTKENTSNGDIATVDVIFPMDPVWLLLSPTLAKATLVSELDYGSSSRWKFPCSPHDLGTYPVVRGTDDGGEAMPVEESGNILILMDAIAHADGNANFPSRWWPTLTKWAQYLQQFGLDPADQLCTDDFMGHLAHNANLSIKAILALAAYGDLCRMRGDNLSADRYAALAKTDAANWIKVADAGDHSLLAFDKPNTWSQKYNLVWDRILGLNVFSPQVAQKEIAFYKQKLQPFGLPLDSRTNLTKTDWTIWSASLAQNQSDFQTLISPIYAYLNQTTARDPLADSYETNDFHSGGMHARPVVGGLFVKMLTYPAIWKKWSSRDQQKVGNWSPIPGRPVISEIIPTSISAPVTWSYTTTANPPPKDWFQPAFDDSKWQQGPGGFGSNGTPGAVIRTPWTDTPGDIWLRRSFTFPNNQIPPDLQLLLHHDEDVEIYINGILADTEAGYTVNYEPCDISPQARAALKPSAPNIIAIHCHQTYGGQYIDAGLATVQYPPEKQ